MWSCREHPVYLPFIFSHTSQPADFLHNSKTAQLLQDKGPSLLASERAPRVSVLPETLAGLHPLSEAQSRCKPRP